MTQPLSRLRETVPRLLTVGEIARQLRVPFHRVRYVLSTRPIPCVAVAGQARLYDIRALARIRHAISSIDARRQAARGGPVL